MIDSLSKLKNVIKIGKLRLVVAGSDCIKKHHAEYFLNKNVSFMINYGLTQAGPIIINHIFTSKKELTIFDQGVPLGSTIYCDYKLVNDELFLKGSCVSNQDWLQTDDCIFVKNGWFFYSGRVSAGCKIIEKNYQ
jgi:hypothetical protein